MGDGDHSPLADLEDLETEFRCLITEDYWSRWQVLGPVLAALREAQQCWLVSGDVDAEQETYELDSTLDYLEDAAMYIQAVWRGYKTRCRNAVNHIIPRGQALDGLDKLVAHPATLLMQATCRFVSFRSRF